MTDEQTDGRLEGKGSNAPVFSGEDEDFDRWMKRLELWLHDTNVKEDKQAARIVNSQTNGAVLDLLLDIPMAQLKTKEGVQLIIEAMEKTFGKDKAVLAWQAFVQFFLMERNEGEKAVDFVRRMENQFHKVQGHDAEVRINDRTLAMIALMRLDLNETDRAQILTRCGTELTPKKVVRAIQALFTKDPKSIPKPMPLDTVHSFVSEEDHALFVKRFGKAPGAGLVCHRCGKSGHVARDCQTPWEKIVRVREANGASAYAAVDESSDEEDGEQPDREEPVLIF